jgi:hypothetical protein
VRRDCFIFVAILILFLKLPSALILAVRWFQNATPRPHQLVRAAPLQVAKGAPAHLGHPPQEPVRTAELRMRLDTVQAEVVVTSGVEEGVIRWAEAGPVIVVAVCARHRVTALHRPSAMDQW